LKTSGGADVRVVAVFAEAAVGTARAGKWIETTVSGSREWMRAGGGMVIALMSGATYT
jgi:hypothetical protein